MADPLKIAVIGAGLIGLSCADALMQAAPTNTVAVSVFEKNTGPVRGTSFCNSGMIHPSQSQSWGLDGQVCDALTHAANVSVHDLATRSRRILLENFERLNLTEMLNRPKGCVQIYADISAAQSAQQAFGQCGIDSSILMDDVNTLGHAGILFPDDMSGNARLYGEGLAASLKSRGVHIMYGITDIRFRPQDMGVVIELRDRATVAQTLAHFDHVILAAGPQSREVLKPLGLSIQMDLVKGHAVNYARPDMALPNMPVMDAATRSALTVFEDHIRLSGTWNEPDEMALLTRWRDIAPHVMERLASPLFHWSAHRPASRAGRPYISATSIPHIWINTGHGHLGWTLCAASAELMARMILDGDADKRFFYSG